MWVSTFVGLSTTISFDQWREYIAKELIIANNLNLFKTAEMTSMKMRTQMLYHLVSLRWFLWNWGHRCYTSSSVWDDFYENKDTDVIPSRQSEMISMKMRTQMLYHLVSLRWFLWKCGHRCYTISSVWDDFYENKDTYVIPPRQSEIISMKLRTPIVYQLVSLRWFLWK